MRTDIGGHDNDSVFKVDRAPLGIRHPAVIEDLQQDVEHVVMRFLDLYWLSAPAFAHGGEPHVHWLDLALPMSLAAVWLGYFVYQLRGRALLPLYDPEFREALKHVRIA